MKYTYVIKIEDMKCDKCAKRVKEALESLGDTVAQVNLKKGEAKVDTSERVEDLYQAVKDAGFSVTDIEMI